MTRKHGAAIRAITLSPVAEGTIQFRLISAKRDVIQGKIGGERRDLYALDGKSLEILIDNAGEPVGQRLRSDQAAILFQPYSPFVDGLAGANHCGHMLEELGALLDHDPDNVSQSESTLPAAYTYLGQFIAHDVSRMCITQDDDVFNFRTPRLDLDSLFGAIDAEDPNPANSVEVRGGLGLGLTAGAPCNRKDLPRAVSGEAQIADARNDANLAVAQFTVMITRFYWKMLARHGNAADAKRVTIHHFQHVVLDDYLRKVIDPVAFADIVDHGPTIIARAPFFVPFEFALAAFRVGHSMVRDHYSEFSGSLSAGLTDLPLHTFRGGALDDRTDNEYRLLNNWVVNWASLIDLPGFEPNRAMAIDELISVGLSDMPTWQFQEIVNHDGTTTDPSSIPKGMSFQLPVQTLLRGRMADLPDAQTLHAAINARLPAAAQLPAMLSAAEIAAVTSPDLNQFLNRADVNVTTSTPLWFYCLRESARPPASGNRFGPLTSRIVMETIFTAIAEDPDGILAWDGAPKGFVPDENLVNAEGTFGLREFVHFAITC